MKNLEEVSKLEVYEDGKILVYTDSKDPLTFQLILDERLRDYLRVGGNIYEKRGMEWIQENGNRTPSFIGSQLSIILDRID